MANVEITPQQMWDTLVEVRDLTRSLDQRLTTHIENDREAFEAHLEAIRNLQVSKASVEIEPKVRSLELKFYGFLAGGLAAIALLARGTLPL